MGLLGLHAILYVAGGVLLVLLWLMLGGDPGALTRPLPAARDEGLWPFWVVTVWGTLLAAHAALTVLVRRRRRRRRRRRPGRAPGGEPRWVTVVFTDICGSTRLADELGDRAFGELITRHRDTVRAVARRHDGTEVGTQGDGFLLRFPSPAPALGAAAALQRRLARERADGAAVPHVRIGVHAGEAVARDGDVLGRTINVASRVADAAEPDEVLVTEPVADHAAPATPFDDRGLRPLRGVEGERHLLALRWDADER